MSRNEMAGRILAHAFNDELEKIALTLGYGDEGIGGERRKSRPAYADFPEEAPRGKPIRGKLKPPSDLRRRILEAIEDTTAEAKKGPGPFPARPQLASTPARSGTSRTLRRAATGVAAIL